ncbi:hypothetical protein [Nostoc sp.]|uniref:hypothetical protein n=1 Tax=Nostoc sp. TaxID=1180 RepID=UPI002FF66589
MQTISLTDKSSLPHRYPQSEQIWLVGSHLLMTTKLRLSLVDLASHIVLNSRYPAMLIACDRQRFFSIPDTFKSSKAITWFSHTTLVDSLCRK